MTMNSMATMAAAPTESAAHLLEHYRPESSFFFSSPAGTLLAQGVHELISMQPGTTHREALATRVAASLEVYERSGHKRAVVVGAVPFDAASPARLAVPKAVQTAGPLTPSAAAPRPRPMGAHYQLRMIPEPRDYVRSVEQALAFMRTEELRKVVLARMLALTPSKPVDVERLLHRLAQQNPNGYTFAADLSEPHAGSSSADPSAPATRPRTLIGASPELLVSRSGLKITANPLAGSAQRSADPEEDRRRASALLTSEKDRREHKIVIDAVAAALEPFCRSLSVPAQPSLTQTNTMWHLSSRVTGELADPSISSLALAIALHPTPAVCGHPVERARTAIKALEPFDRGFFTGIVGWCDAAGDGEWAVAIRCAEVTEDSLRLYSGAGIVPGSDAERELAETSAKLRTMLNALGVDQIAEVIS